MIPNALAPLAAACLLLPLAPLPSATPTPPAQDPAPGVEDPEARAARERLQAAFSAADIGFDPERGVVSIPVVVEVTNDLLEYVLCAPHGAVHETLFVTGVEIELLNTALIALGLRQGENASWTAKEPAPTREELEAGASAYDIVLPEGDTLYLYAGWREGDEEYLYRVEDLVRDRFRGRTLRRHPLVYLGSKLVERREGEAPVFAAAMDGNLINLSFFAAGHTLLTTALPECIDQTAWLANAWLLPERGSEVRLFFSREKLTRVPPEASPLPVVPERER